MLLLKDCAETINAGELTARRGPPRLLVVATNIARLASATSPESPLEVLPINEPATLSGARRLLKTYRHAHALLIDDASLLLPLCVLRWLRPRWLFGGPLLFALDVVLNKPWGFKDWLAAYCKRWLFAPVDHFLHYFQDVADYDRYYGISAQRSTYVPFKVNGWEEILARGVSKSAGDYVFTSGRSMRDYATFMEAMERTGLPGVLTYHRRELTQEHGTPFPPKKQLPNVRIEEDDGSLSSWIERIAGARVVAIPILPESIRAVGISLALMALGLGKCVVISEGNTTRGVFGDEVVTVPVGDAGALAAALQRAYHDEAFRRQKGEAGRRLAERLGGEKELYQRLCAVVRSKVWGSQE